VVPVEFPVTVESQSAFDDLVKTRLAREREKFADYDELKQKATELTTSQEQFEAAITAANQRAEAAEGALSERQKADEFAQVRAEVAKTAGVPADALRGSTKEELEAHAEVLKPLVTAPKGPVIPNQGSTPDAPPVNELRAFARGLFERATAD